MKRSNLEQHRYYSLETKFICSYVIPPLFLKYLRETNRVGPPKKTDQKQPHRIVVPNVEVDLVVLVK